MYGKIIIHCVLTVKTGLHIGDSSAFSAIGAVDSPVVRDPYTNRPIIPGSSLKGKIRTLLVRSKCKDIEHMPTTRMTTPPFCGFSVPLRLSNVPGFSSLTALYPMPAILQALV